MGTTVGAMTATWQYLGSVWERAMARFEARAWLQALVDELTDDQFDELLNPAPLDPMDDRELLALDEARIAAEGT